MRNSTLLYGRNLFWIALQARNLNYNLYKNLQIESVFSVCSVDFFCSLKARCFGGNLV